MKIAQIIGFYKDFSPEVVWGITGVAYDLTEELVKRGHEVTAFAPKNSKTSALLPEWAPPAILKDKRIPPDEEARNFVGKIYSIRIIEEAKKFDIIHNHWLGTIPYLRLMQRPAITTLHGGGFTLGDKIVAKFCPEASYVAIAKHIIRKSPEFNYAGVVYNGINLSKFHFSDNQDNQRDHLCWLGRADPEKGLDIAIKIAKKSNNKLLIGAIIGPERQEYFDKKIKPLIDNKQIILKGEIKREQREVFLGSAKALLMPIQWEEPFGLVVIEAMACGTPVIAFRKGSMEELIIDGKNGFVVDNEKEMIEAVKDIDKIDRKECRRYVEEHFSVSKMADGYEKVYQKIITKQCNKKNGK